MFESKAQAIANCLQCNRGTYPLARAFGGDLVDTVARNPRQTVQTQLAIYYPEISVTAVTMVMDDTGLFTSDVIIKGGENATA